MHFLQSFVLHKVLVILQISIYLIGLQQRLRIRFQHLNQYFTLLNVLSILVRRLIQSPQCLERVCVIQELDRLGVVIEPGALFQLGGELILVTEGFVLGICGAVVGFSLAAAAVDYLIHVFVHLVS